MKTIQKKAVQQNKMKHSKIYYFLCHFFFIFTFLGNLQIIAEEITITNVKKLDINVSNNKDFPISFLIDQDENIIFFNNKTHNINEFSKNGKLKDSYKIDRKIQSGMSVFDIMKLNDTLFYNINQELYVYDIKNKKNFDGCNGGFFINYDSNKLIMYSQNGKFYHNKLFTLPFNNSIYETMGFEKYVKNGKWFSNDIEPKIFSGKIYNIIDEYKGVTLLKVNIINFDEFEFVNLKLDSSFFNSNFELLYVSANVKILRSFSEDGPNSNESIIVFKNDKYYNSYKVNFDRKIINKNFLNSDELILTWPLGLIYEFCKFNNKLYVMYFTKNSAFVGELPIFELIKEE